MCYPDAGTRTSPEGGTGGGSAAAPSPPLLWGHIWQNPSEGRWGFAAVARTRSTTAAPGSVSGQTMLPIFKCPRGPPARPQIFGAWKAAGCIALWGDAGITFGSQSAPRDGHGEARWRWPEGLNLLPFSRDGPGPFQPE